MRYVVSNRALETIERECRKHPDAETGGILVGFRDKEQAVVTHATGPGPQSQRSAHHFVKDTPYLQTVLNLLFQYYQVNYLGVWHKHPDDMPYPSTGDLASAMDEIGDDRVGLEEMVTPICVMESGRVQVVPYVIKGKAYARVSWDALPHDGLPVRQSVTGQWYNTAVGQRRFSREMERFKELGVAAEVRRGADGTFRFYAPLGQWSPQRLVMLCYNDYPVSPPEVALYDELSKKYEPVASRALEEWDISRYMSDVFAELRGASPTPPPTPPAQGGQTTVIRRPTA